MMYSNRAGAGGFHIPPPPNTTAGGGGSTAVTVNIADATAASHNSNKIQQYNIPQNPPNIAAKPPTSLKTAGVDHMMANSTTALGLENGHDEGATLNRDIFQKLFIVPIKNDVLQYK